MALVGTSLIASELGEWNEDVVASEKRQGNPKCLSVSLLFVRSDCDIELFDCSLV
jgi:hypothetical protein